MDNKIAATLIASLLERVEHEERYAGISSLERAALAHAASMLGYSGKLGRASPEAVEPPMLQIHEGSPPQRDAAETVPEQELPQAVKPVKLSLAAMERSAPFNNEVLLCLDFGTAMSKAFAQLSNPREHLDLALGAEAGGQGYTLPSSLFVGNDQRMYFGFEALDRSQRREGAGRQRIDSIKSWLNLGSETDMDNEQHLLSPAQNPTDTRLTNGDVTRLYLAFLTDVAGRALAGRGVAQARHVRRRFARPCGRSVEQAKWLDSRMAKMLAQAQIIADTLTGRWPDGIPVAELRAVLDAVTALETLPDDLIEDGVAEPVAVAASAIQDSENQRDAYMVVDIGAGTTDFGLFVATTRPADGERVVQQIEDSVIGLAIAGDAVDRLLKGFIGQQESVDATDPAGRLIMDDLGRQIRTMKEVLFQEGRVDYVLRDGTSGTVHLDEFLADPRIKKLGLEIEKGFTKSLEALDPTWFNLLSVPGVFLHVILTGGGSRLPMMQSLATGVINVGERQVERRAVDPKPWWVRDMSDEFGVAYQQLAVAIGGAQPKMPETFGAPKTFGGGSSGSVYVAGNVQISGV